jgi:hypothetical protein
LIIFVTTENHRYTHATLDREDIAAKVMSYGEMQQQASKLPVATYVFTDLDRLNNPQLHQVALYYRQLRELGLRVVTDPARVRSRFGLLRALNRAGINDFDAYRAEDLDKPKRWPVFIRAEGNHSAPASGLLHSQAELDAALDDCVRDGVPVAALLIIEYCAEPLENGLYRKLSVFRIADRLIGYTCVHDNQWLVKYGEPGIATPELYQEEHEFVTEHTFAEAMRPMFDMAGVEYGRVDFGMVGGRPQIYEINTNPDLKLRTKPSSVALRNDSNQRFRENFLEALRAIDTVSAAAPSLNKSRSTA